MGRPRKVPAPDPAPPNSELRQALAAAESADQKFMAEVLLRIRYETYSRFITLVHFKKLRALAAYDLWSGLDDAGIRAAAPETIGPDDDLDHMRGSTKYVRIKNALKRKAKEITRLREESDPKKMLESMSLAAVETVRDTLLHNPNKEAALDAASQVMDRHMPKPQRQGEGGTRVVVISGDFLGQLGAAEREMKQITNGGS